MKATLAPTQNMQAFLAIFEALKKRSPGQPRIGMAYGQTGLGKTQAMYSAVNKYNAVYLCANPTWSSRTLLEKMCEGLGGVKKHRLSEMHDQVVARLTFTGKTILLDECDSIFDDPKLIETYRSLHDASEHSTFVLVGMERVKQKIARYPQLARRISQVVEFQMLSVTDVELVVKTRSEVKMSDELILALHQRTKGHLAKVCSAIEQIEEVGKQLKRPVTLEDWGENPLPDYL